MHYSMLLTILCAVGAIGSPIRERDYVTDLEVVTITRTVTDGYPETIPYNFKEEYSGPTELPSSHYHNHKGHKSPAPSTSSCHPSSSSSPPLPPTSTTTINAVAPLPTSTTTTSTAPPSTYAAPSQNNYLAASSSTPPSPASTTTDNSYQGQLLHYHNRHRANHSASDLVWDSDLEACAQTLASRCVYQHDTSIRTGGQTDGYGQNIGYGISADDMSALITGMMYNGEFGYFTYYGEASPPMDQFERWGHLSQIIWKATTSVGCATVVCQNLGNSGSSEPLPFTVCNYGPAGNVDSEYASNIGKPLGQPYIAG